MRPPKQKVPKRPTVELVMGQSKTIIECLDSIDAITVYMVLQKWISIVAHDHGLRIKYVKASDYEKMWQDAVMEFHAEQIKKVWRGNRGS